MIVAATAIASTILFQGPGASSETHALLDRVRSAHADVPPMECRYDIASACAGPDGEKVKSLLATAPRVRRWTDPVTGQERLIWLTVRALYDGTGAWRVETENLTLFGPRDLTITVKIQSARAMAQAPALQSVQATLTTIEPDAPTDEIECRRRGIATMEELVAREGYATLVRWAAHLLGRAPDLRSLEGGTGIGSSALGIDLWADTQTGEVGAIRVHNPTTGPTTWRFEGRLDDPIFPARHPRVIRVVAPRPDRSAGDDGACLVVQSARRTDPEAAMFEVASLATDFFDPRTRTRTDEHGKPLGPPIGARRSPAHSQEQARELADSASRAPRVAMAAGVACLLVGAIIWWRRKAAG